jgi:2-dehydropantoate 2-reductase
MNTKPSYGLVGRGRVAAHLARYLELEAQPCVSWHRGMPQPAEEVLAGCDVVLLAINDGALPTFLDAQPGFAGLKLVHFSGSLAVEGLHGAHPLMTFGPELYDLETYRSIPFITECGGARFEDLFPGLVNPSWAIDRELKPLYHALCVLGGNFTTLLWAKVQGDFEARLGLPGEALRPFLERTFRNVAASGGAALTGPLARREHGTVARDLAALAGDPFAPVYRAFVEAFEREEVTA